MNKADFFSIPEKDRLGRVLKGKAFYASVHTPNMSGVAKFKSDPYYIVNLGLTPDEAKKAESYGLKVLPPEGEIDMPYVKIKRKVSKDKTPDFHPETGVAPEVVDTAQRAIPKSILIGNKSDVILKFATYWYDTSGGGIGTSMYKVQVVSLVPYIRKDKDFVNDGSGFTVNAVDSDSSINDTDFEGDELPWETPASK